MDASTRKASSGGRDIVITRVLDAPRELVFEVWIDPRHIASWWGPRGFTTTTYEMDVRPGGVWRFMMHGPDGVDYPNKIVYHEIVKPERLVYTHGGEDDSGKFEVTVSFAEQDGKTMLTMRSLFESTAERDKAVRLYKAIEGGNQTLDRLEETLRNMGRRLVMTRVFDAPRQRVWDAFTDPVRLKRWWGPKHFTNPVCELDLRPGGAIRIDMRAPDGVVYPMTGVYQEIAEPERLVFTSAALDASGNPLFEVLNVITFVEQGGKTRLTIDATVSKAIPEADRYLAGMNEGWSQSLERLAEEVKS